MQIRMIGKRSKDMKPCHQPGGQARSTDLIDGDRATGCVELRPIDAAAQLQRFMPGIEDRAKHVGPSGSVGLGGPDLQVIYSGLGQSIQP